jgi:hypothetical protein
MSHRVALRSTFGGCLSIKERPSWCFAIRFTSREEEKVMYLRILAVIVVLACAFSPATQADDHETMTLEEFQEFGELVVGRWVVDIKFCITAGPEFRSEQLFATWRCALPSGTAGRARARRPQKSHGAEDSFR